MSTFTKTLAIGFTVLALGAMAHAKGNSSGGGNGGAGGNGGEPGIMSAAPMTHAQNQPRSRNRSVRVIEIHRCSDGIAVMNKPVCIR